MPTSDLRQAFYVVNTVHELPHRTVLDVGPGWGKYAVLLREYLNEKPERIGCVEAWAPYVDEHRLDLLYDEIMVGDACDVPQETLDRYELVLMVDVIEHIEKDRALEFLDRCPGYVVVLTPVDWFQTDEGLPSPERHVSHWTCVDFPADRVRSCYEHQAGLFVVLGPRPEDAPAVG